MSDLITAVTAIEKVSGSYKLIKKLPIIGELLMHREHEERMDQAISEKIVHEYKLTDDPIYQMEFLNSIDDNDLKKEILVHLLDVKEGRQQRLNVLATIQEFITKTEDVKTQEIDDEEIHPDWWSLWQEKARLTSDPVKREILAEALKRETIKIGSIHPRLIRILGDLSIQEINKFKMIVKRYDTLGRSFSTFSLTEGAFGDDVFPHYSHSELENLNEAGLISFPSGFGAYTTCIPYNDRGVNVASINYDLYVILVWTDKKFNLGIASTITNIGLSLKSLITNHTELEFIKKIADIISQKNSCTVSIHKRITSDKCEGRSIYSSKYKG